MSSSGINTKINLLFRSPNGRPNDELRDGLAAEVSRLRKTVPPTLNVRAGVGMDPEKVAHALKSLHADGRESFGASGYQGLLWIAGPGGTIDELTHAVHGIGQRLAGLIDADHSAAVAGTEEFFLPGDGPAAGMYAVRRRPGDSYEQFHDFWRLEHTKLSMYIPGFRYRQLHAVGYANRAAAASAGIGVTDIDGVIEYFFDSIDYQVEMTHLENFQEIYEDEKNFIDHQTATFSYVDFLD